MYHSIWVTSRGMVCKLLHLGSIISFTETVKTKELVANDLANLPKNLARTHYESHSVSRAYFRVSVCDCAIHSSRWEDFAYYCFGGFSFFSSIGI